MQTWHFLAASGINAVGCMIWITARTYQSERYHVQEKKGQELFDRVCREAEYTPFGTEDHPHTHDCKQYQ